MLGTLSNVELLKTLAPVLGYSLLCGGIIGFERGRRGSSAGMKTQVFICVGSALFSVCSIILCNERGTGDAGRMIAQIVSGVGFLGAGTIMARDRIIGLTTAAIIWVMAALGVMIGMGYGPSALVVSAVMVGAIELISQIEKRFVQTHTHDRRQPPLSLAPLLDEKTDEKTDENSRKSS
ncbi:MAG: MgtC/SapB family protein [Bdellovibrionota bacterium]